MAERGEREREKKISCFPKLQSCLPEAWYTCIHYCITFTYIYTYIGEMSYPSEFLPVSHCKPYCQLTVGTVYPYSQYIEPYNNIFLIKFKAQFCYVFTRLSLACIGTGVYCYLFTCLSFFKYILYISLYDPRPTTFQIEKSSRKIINEMNSKNLLLP
jgi:hypothetical protein